jgi:hypothetical protein
MSGWLTVLVHLPPASEADQAFQDAQRQLEPLSGSVINLTQLVEPDGRRAGTLVALEKEAWETALELAQILSGQARAFRMAEALVAPKDAPAPSGAAFVSLAANLKGASLHFDDPAVSGAMRAALGEYLPLLGQRLLATSSLMVRDFDYGGAITVFEADSVAQAAALASYDTWARIYPNRLFGAAGGFFSRTPPPPGPVIQRYGASTPWPGGRFS